MDLCGVLWNHIFRITMVIQTKCPIEPCWIRMCTQLSREGLHRVFHEMGHVQYYMAYRFQPVIFRSGATSALHEALGEAMAELALSPECMRRQNISLIPETVSDDVISLLLRHALRKIAFLPWALVVDKWRYDVFSGAISPGKMNKWWWKLREKFQGIKPPAPGTEKDFDPGSKYHIANNIPYLRYYFSTFLQYQLLQDRCSEVPSEAAKPLHRCCLFGSTQAGHKLKTLMSLGSSLPWPRVASQFFKHGKLTAAPLLAYFRPLKEWLIQENRKSGAAVGWFLQLD
ncbi:angiotensin-converting enzyme-like [Tachypleus tridentatus]|uniref:angiotensin-converting enzyme-like n=1 Tax=Tachypleus tridentatus TaxID=6853 RepID=UPI003FD3BF95